MSKHTNPDSEIEKFVDEAVLEARGLVLGARMNLEIMEANLKALTIPDTKEEKSNGSK